MWKLTLLASLALTSVASFTSLASAEPRDGSHDFDFELGTWKIKLRRLEHALSGSTKWIEYNGTSTTKPLMGGKAQVVELTVDSTTGVHLEGMTVRTYNPATHQWYLSWANAKNGIFAQPPTVGEFKNGRGEFYDSEEYEGRWILVRLTWSQMTKTSAHFEQAFSADGGKTWEVNWITDQVRTN
ncbi:MAG TPA: hypothetical protein VLT45_09955 [Kofleriaceae bacterium]|nr:hypothetical protein [Kofleriaceae bacterium]